MFIYILLLLVLVSLGLSISSFFWKRCNMKNLEYEYYTDTDKTKPTSREYKNCVDKNGNCCVCDFNFNKKNRDCGYIWDNDCSLLWRLARQ